MGVTRGDDVCADDLARGCRAPSIRRREQGNGDVSSGQENLIAMGTKMYKYASNSYRNSNVVAMAAASL